MDGHVRIGERWCRLAEGDDWYQETGLRPYRKPFQSIFPGRQNTPGAPGVQNLRDDDLPWLNDSWSRGEGQEVIAPVDASSFTKFAQSQGIDFSTLGSLRLAKAMIQQGLTGASPTTIEGNAWTDEIGTSTVVGTDRRINAIGDELDADTGVLSAQNFAFDIYAYEDPTPITNGSAFTEVSGQTQVSGSGMRLKSAGAVVRLQGQDPVNGDVDLEFVFSMAPPAPPGSAKVTCKVIDENNGDVVDSDSKHPGSDKPGTTKVSLSFNAQGGHTYKYVVTCETLSGDAEYVLLESLSIDERDDRTVSWEIRRGVTVVASGTEDMNGITATKKIVSAVILATAAVHTFAVTRSTGTSRKVYVEKGVYGAVTMGDPRIIELGLSDDIWLVDSSTTKPQLFKWAPATQSWTLIGAAFGANLDLVGAMTHTDHYLYITNTTDKRVWRSDGASTPVGWTDASADALVGVTYGAGRIWTLTESQANGTRLWSYDPEAAPLVAVPGTPSYAPGNKGSTPDVDLPGRLAGTAAGCVFFCNQGPDTWVYAFDAGASAGSPLGRLTPGFRARAIEHGNGFTWIGGAFPTKDAAGALVRRPAIEVLGSSGVPELLDVKLYRDTDTSGHVIDMELYGTDLWVLCSVDGVKMRLWRISLRTPVAAFLEQEIATDVYQAAGAARGLAVTWRDRFIIWSKGAPYLQSTTYAPSGRLLSSRYAFGLTEPKELLAIDVDGSFPAGTSVEVQYALNDGAMVSAGVWTENGRKPVSRPAAQVFFGFLQLDTILMTGNAGLTPVVYAVRVKAYCPLSDYVHELIVVFGDPTSGYTVAGRAQSGAELADYLENLFRQGGVIEYEDRYTSAGPTTHVCSFIGWDPSFKQPGEGLARIKLLER